MRRQAILTTLIVLLFIGSANAIPVLSFVDEWQTIITTPGSVVRLEIETNETMFVFMASIEVDGDAIITGAISSADADDYGWDNVSYPIDPIGLGTKTVEIGAEIFSGNSGPLVAYVEVTYGSGNVIVSGHPVPLFPNPTNEFSPGVVTIVPEPATLVLLVLGALTLRRKSRP